MQTTQTIWTDESRWTDVNGRLRDADLVLAFAGAAYFQTQACYQDLRNMFPRAHIVGCSSAGSVLGDIISDDDVVATAVRFSHGTVRLAVAQITADSNIEELASGLLEQLRSDDLRHVLVFSDGLMANGSDLARGLNRHGIPVTGGLAGDGTRFHKTWVMADAPARPGCIAAVGLYGDIAVRSGCFAGWQEFGAERRITKSSGNVVSEIDHHPALTLYKKYLGELARDLPGSAVRFPMSVRKGKDQKAVIRTVMAVDEATQSLTFAGDMPEGYLCKLMKTNEEDLIEHAGMAALAALPAQQSGTGLCLIVSCVGRRQVLGQMTEDELDVVQEKLNPGTTIAGFYSYGELAPHGDITACEFHNQTMTLTTIHEQQTVGNYAPSTSTPTATPIGPGFCAG